MQETPYLQDRVEHWIEQFKQVPFLRSLNDKYLREILALSKIRKYDPGEVIIPEGVYDSWIYILMSGAVRVIKQEKEIARMDHVGDVVGELALIDGEPRSASVCAITKTICLAMDGSFLDRLSAEDLNAFYAVFFKLLAEILAERLRHTSEELAAVRDELARFKQGRGV